VTARIVIGGRDANMRSVLEYRLKDAGYSVVVSPDSADAWVRATMEQPDLVILDLSIPYSDAKLLLEQIKTEDRSRRPPVLILSTYRADELQGDYPNLEGVEFVLKPFSPRQLVADVAQIMGK
jgi:DNA-binding response OmpR family regulator